VRGAICSTGWLRELSCLLAKLEIVGHKPAYYLNPVFTVDGRKVVLLMQEMAGASVKRLDTFVVALAELRPEIVRVLDVALNGGPKTGLWAVQFHFP